MTTYEKLTITADHLEQNVRDHEFNLGFYRNHCGAVGCAIGHACRIKQFNDMGFRLMDSSKDVAYPWFRGAWAGQAIELFYGINTAEVDWLFMPSEYGTGLDDFPTRANVIARIRSVAAEYAEPRVATEQATIKQGA